MCQVSIDINSKTCTDINGLFKRGVCDFFCLKVEMCCFFLWGGGGGGSIDIFWTEQLLQISPILTQKPVVIYSVFEHCKLNLQYMITSLCAKIRVRVVL